MSLRKVYGGTPVGNESRCDTCSNARIIQGYAESERIVLCDATYPALRVPFKVMQCSMYDDRRLPDYDKLEAIAWRIQPKGNGNVPGFVTVADDAKQPSKKAEQEVVGQPEMVPVGECREE
jgi:hypothetical protein